MARGKLLTIKEDVGSGGRDRTADLGVMNHNPGGVAGFPLPVLRYFVGAAGDSTLGIVRQVTPADNKTFAVKESVDFAWLDIDKGAFYHVEITDGDGKTLVTALLPARLGTLSSSIMVTRTRRTENCALDGASPGTRVGSTSVSRSSIVSVSRRKQDCTKGKSLTRPNSTQVI